MAEKAKYTAVLTESELYDGQQVTELPVVGYEFVGSMYMFELANGTSLSVGTGIVEAVQPVEEASS